MGRHAQNTIAGRGAREIASLLGIQERTVLRKMKGIESDFSLSELILIRMTYDLSWMELEHDIQEIRRAK